MTKRLERISSVEEIRRNANNLLIISAAVLVVDVILSYVSRATLRREEIPTKWK